MTDNEIGPGLMSPAARAFAAAATPMMAAPSKDTIAEIRAATVAEFEPRARRSAKRHGVTTSWTEVGGVSCLDVRPAGAEPDATVLYGYGGGYICGGPEQDLIIAAPLAAKIGARVVLPNYRLAPEHPWPAAPDDGFAVYRALAAEGPFALAGESAGANLAMALMLRARRAGLAQPVAAALMSPWCDLNDFGDSLTANDGRDPTLGGDNGAASGLYAGEHDRTDPDISPIYGDWSGDFPPMIITTGTRDLLLSHAVRAARVLREAGVRTDLRVWDGMWHVFEFYDELPEAAQSIGEIADFLSAALRPASKA